jgi:hypothetical protein
MALAMRPLLGYQFGTDTGYKMALENVGKVYAINNEPRTISVGQDLLFFKYSNPPSLSTLSSPIHRLCLHCRALQVSPRTSRAFTTTKHRIWQPILPSLSRHQRHRHALRKNRKQPILHHRHTSTRRNRHTPQIQRLLPRHRLRRHSSENSSQENVGAAMSIHNICLRLIIYQLRSRQQQGRKKTEKLRTMKRSMLRGHFIFRHYDGFVSLGQVIRQDVILAMV